MSPRRRKFRPPLEQKFLPLPPEAATHTRMWLLHRERQLQKMCQGRYLRYFSSFRFCSEGNSRDSSQRNVGGLGAKDTSGNMGIEAFFWTQNNYAVLWEAESMLMLAYSRGKEYGKPLLIGRKILSESTSILNSSPRTLKDSFWPFSHQSGKTFRFPHIRALKVDFIFLSSLSRPRGFNLL